MSHARGIMLWAACLGTGACACAADNGDGADPVSVSPGAGSGAAKTAVCSDEYLAYSTGEENGLRVSIADSSFEVRLLDSDQAPPPRKGYNTWTIAVRDATTGEPAVDATISWACAWMDVHGHGTNPKMVEALGDGNFRLVKQNFSMTGPWLVRLWVDPTGKEPLYEPQGISTIADGAECHPTTGLQGAPNAVFKICVPEKF